MPETQNAPLHDHLAGLNPEQRAAAAHGAGPLLVIAGAGSGKTATLAHRVAHLIAGGADPRRILLMTFSRRAAAEMTARAGRIVRAALGERGAALAEGLVWAGTFHAMGARLLREVGPAVGLDPGFSLHDREDSADLMNLVRHELGLATSERRFPGKGTCLAIYSRAVNGRTAVGDVVRAQFPWCAGWEAELRRLFAAYVAAKQAQGVLDYDDLLLWWAEAAAEPGLAAEMGGRFDHVLVDEYQDTNRLQAEILMRLKPDGAGVTVVGDDCQSIYAFRAAEVRNILDFPGAFAPRAAVVTLERNYRSVAPILAASDAVIAEARERFAKVLRAERDGGARPLLVALRDEGAQAAYVCERVLAAREEGAALKAQAVLFRAAHHAAPLEVELTRRGVPFVKFGGLKFLEARHVKDMLALLRFAENPRDRVAGFRALLLVPGVGPVGAAEALDALGRGAGLAAPRRAGADWAAFAAAFATLRRGEAGWPGDVAAARAWYEPQLERLHEDAAARRADLAALEQIAATYPSRERFLTELTLDPPDATSAHAGAPLKDEDYLILSTIHSAKGQEWSQVFVLNCIDGCIPSDLGTGTVAEAEEERRLLYVAMTRAKDALHLLTPQRFFVHGQAARGDRHVYAMRSRFLPDHLLGHFEQTAWPLAAAAPAPQAPHVAVDLRGRMRRMWQAG